MKWIIFGLTIAFLVFLEYAFHSSLHHVGSNKLSINSFAYSSSFLTLIVFLLFIIGFRKQNNANYKFPFRMMGLLITLLVPKLYTALFLALFFGLNWFNITLNALIVIGLTLAFLQFTAILYGIFVGKYKYQIRKIQLQFPHLPADLDQLKLVQISDLHLGSFFNRYHKLEKAINKINSINADYVLFTGDLVNNFAQEVKGWENTLKKIKSKKGVYSILGNHDYGDYVNWKEKIKYDQNIAELVEYHTQIGFKLLRNSSIALSNEENKAFLIGVENWGAPPFKQYGDLKQATENIPTDSFKILLSHDPSHFDYEVTKQTNIDLTLSGHTHGMQFGFERWGLKISPVQLKYPKWAGLYRVKNQFLYVNRGLGYIGFPGRVGIYPEITEITLTKDKTEVQS